MKKLFTAILFSLALTLTGVPGISTPPQAEAAVSSWRVAGVYHCYESACRTAYQLERCGYCTCVKCYDGCYYVYYK